MQAFVEQLHGNKQRWVPIVDPGIKVEPGYPAYDQGLAAKAFITDVTGSPYLGQVGPLASHNAPCQRCYIRCVPLCFCKCKCWEWRLMRRYCPGVNRKIQCTR